MVNEFYISEIQFLAVQNNTLVLRVWFKSRDTGGRISFIYRFDRLHSNRWILHGDPPPEISEVEGIPWE